MATRNIPGLAFGLALLALGPARAQDAGPAVLTADGRACASGQLESHASADDQAAMRLDPGMAKPLRTKSP